MFAQLVYKDSNSVKPTFVFQKALKVHSDVLLGTVWNQQQMQQVQGLISQNCKASIYIIVVYETLNIAVHSMLVVASLQDQPCLLDAQVCRGNLAMCLYKQASLEAFQNNNLSVTLQQSIYKSLVVPLCIYKHLGNIELIRYTIKLQD